MSSEEYYLSDADDDFGDQDSQQRRQQQQQRRSHHQRSLSVRQFGSAPIPPPHLYFGTDQPHRGRPQQQQQQQQLLLLRRRRARSVGFLDHLPQFRARHPWEPLDDDTDPMASLFPSLFADHLQPTNNSGRQQQQQQQQQMHGGVSIGPHQQQQGQGQQQQQQQQQAQLPPHQQQQQQTTTTNNNTNGVNHSGLNIGGGGGGGGGPPAAVGAGGGGGGGAGGGPTGINVYPTAAGHQLDLNYLWQQVQELSAVLQQNREATQGIIRSVVELQRRAALAAAENGGVAGEISLDEVVRVINENTGGNIVGLNNDAELAGAAAVGGGGVGGNHIPASNTASASANTSTDAATAAAAAAAATIADLRLQMGALTERNEFLAHEVHELTDLLQAYEVGLGRVLELVRNFSHENTTATLAIHRNYNDQLAAERQTNLELRQEYIDFQARLVNLNGIMREGLRYAENDTELREIEMWAALRQENRVLRRLIGLPVDESDDGSGSGSGGGSGEDRQSSSAGPAGAVGEEEQEENGDGHGDGVGVGVGGSGGVGFGGGDGAGDGVEGEETQQVKEEGETTGEKDEGEQGENGGGNKTEKGI
ncbi:MAG: hypothetical protein M1816_007748 [Peltula sp. TS41687]|nr:MAG: hypothetical protein M1816_007748 [Peltula sp. TS41687]